MRSSGDGAAEARDAIALGLAVTALGNVLGLLDPPRRPPRARSVAGLLLCAGSAALALSPGA